MGAPVLMSSLQRTVGPSTERQRDHLAFNIDESSSCEHALQLQRGSRIFNAVERSYIRITPLPDSVRFGDRAVVRLAHIITFDNLYPPPRLQYPSRGQRLFLQSDGMILLWLRKTKNRVRRGLLLDIPEITWPSRPVDATAYESRVY